jgi:hypothetical protein
MKKAVILVFSLAVSCIGLSQNANIPLSGSYSLVHFYEQNQIVTTMNITPLGENKFEIEGDGWIGEGEVVGNSGYYTWEFFDGRKGKTNFVINTKGEIIGHVLGTMPNPEFLGLDWTYLALPGKNKNT